MPSRQTLLQIFLGVLLLYLAGCSSGGSSPAAVPPVISGTITTAAGSFIDSDTNDPNTTSIPNDDFATAQELQNPFIVGGYVNAGSDQEDHYLASLTQGQTVTLFIADHDTGANLDLFLNDPSTPANNRTSQGITSLETITVPVTATYEIVAHATNGISKYVLTIAASSADTGDIIHIENDFVPGEILVRFKEQSQTPLSMSLPSLTMKRLGLTPSIRKNKRFQLVKLGNASQRRAIMTSLGLPLRQSKATTLSSSDEVLLEKQETIDTIYALRRQHDVASADPNYIRYPAAIPGDPYYSIQWHYPLIDLPAAWDVAANLAVDTSAIKIAVIDTGVYMDPLLPHPDLDGNLSADGYDFISDISMSNDGDGRDADPDDPGDSTTPGLSSFHGTHVAGTIAAVSDNAKGVAGVSWNGLALNSTILPLRVLGIGGGTSNDLIKAVEYAAGLTVPPDPVLAQPVDIINLSLTGTSFSTAEQSVFTAARNAGVLCIAAAGNQNTNVPQYPASYAGVISVSAVDLNKEKTYYSNFGPLVDIAAPGGDDRFDLNGDQYRDMILSTWVDDSGGTRVPTYAFFAGTSMAAPHVSGVASLMKAVHPGLTPHDFDTLLTSGLITEDIGQSGRDDNYGYGLINALKAVEQANRLANGGALPPILSTFPNRLDFSTTLISLDLTTGNGGGGNLSILSFTVTSPWLTVAAVNVDPVTNLGTYTATVDRSGLSDAHYAATITFNTDTAGSIDIPVTMQVGTTAPTDNDAGHHYILLIDPDSWLTKYTIDAESSSGAYGFTFSDIADGSYYIVAGTDTDNNNIICEPGEACGGYPTMEGLVEIIYRGTSMNGLNFTTGFSIQLSSARTADSSIAPTGFARN